MRFLFSPELVVLAIVIVSGPRGIGWDAANDAALDMTILSIGATGGLFLNHKLQEHWGMQTPLYGILAVLANLLLSRILVYRKRWKPEAERTASFRNMWPDLVVGTLAMCLTTGLFVIGYMSGGGGNDGVH